jgi:hypothetical protein
MVLRVAAVSVKSCRIAMVPLLLASTPPAASSSFALNTPAAGQGQGQQEEEGCKEAHQQVHMPSIIGHG